MVRGKKVPIMVMPIVAEILQLSPEEAGIVTSTASISTLSKRQAEKVLPENTTEEAEAAETASQRSLSQSASTRNGLCR